MATEHEYFSDDITFCLQDDCHVARCERHQSNIRHPELPHSYAMLYQTDYCPLITTQKRLMSEGKKSGDIQKKHWIPCSERLPEKNGDYLCSLGDDAHSIEVDTFTDDHFELYNVIAWMPLPESYSGE